MPMLCLGRAAEYRRKKKVSPGSDTFFFYTLSPVSRITSSSFARFSLPISVRGRRRMPESRFMALMAAFTGMGLVSMNRAEKSFAYRA